MKSALKISVITVALNSAAHIEESIKSVLDQTYTDIEYVVIDGGSTDGTVDIVERYGQSVDYFVSEPDKGLYDAMNKGIKAATGDVLFFLNSDDTFRDERVVEDVARAFNENPGVDMVFGNQIFDFGEGGRKVKKQQFKDIRKRLAWTNIQHQTLFARKEVFERVGGFSLEYRIVSDYEWLLRAFLKHKCSYRYIDRDISIMAMQGLSSTTDFEPERRRVMKNYFSLYEIYLYRVFFPKALRLKNSLAAILSSS